MSARTTAKSLKHLYTTGYIDILLYDKPIEANDVEKFWLDSRLRDKLEIYYTPLGELHRQRSR